MIAACRAASFAARAVERGAAAMPHPICFEIRDENGTGVTELCGGIAQLEMSIPAVGGVAYAKDTEGCISGTMQMNASAK
jgi:hypothetical protein